jgi:hypothetical protein
MAAALAGQILSSHLEQAGSAIRTIKQVQEREHDRTSLFDHVADAARGLFPAAFAGRRKQLRRGAKMVSSEPAARGAPLLKTLASL